MHQHSGNIVSFVGEPFTQNRIRSAVIP